MLDRLAAERAGVVKLARVNTMKEPSLATRFGIRGVPAFFLYRNGERLDDVVGAMTRSQIDDWISRTTGM